jgi:hypothetical protein
VIWFRWVIAVPLMLVFVLCAICNIALAWAWVVQRKRSSLALLVGGLAGMAALLVMPVSRFHAWSWVPVVADLAIPYVAGFVLKGVRKLFSLVSPC